MNGLKNHITEEKPATDPDKDWDAKQEIVLGVLEMYCQKDVWTSVSDDSKFASSKAKWDELKRVYGGIGSMSSFNTWTALTSTALDESSPILPQLQKLNDARITLENNDMKLTDLQYCFILIKALPESYSAVASTILATGEPKDLSPQKIQDRILNEEGRRSGASASLNKIAPIKKYGGDKPDKSKVKCFYCQKLGHKRNECRKKKKDEEAEKSGKGNGAQKSVNAHTATIEEIDDNEDLPVSLYAASRSRWMVDSGATHHMTPHRSDFISWTPTKGVVSLGGHAEIQQIGSGTVAIRPSGGDKIVHLHDVMHVPDADSRYFSVSALMQKGGQITFKDKKLLISVRGQKIAEGYQEGNLFWINTSNIALHAITAPTPIELWHARMGHMSYNALKRYSQSVKGITLDPSKDQDLTPCPGCELGKQTRSSFLGSSKRSDRRLRIIHSDLAGPMQSRSIQGSLYIATFIDDYSRHGVVYYLKSKDQCAAAFKKFLAWAENQTSERVLALHSDRGGEYLSSAVRSILDEKGIEHKLTMPHSPQQNGVAERWNRTILDKARALIHSAGLSLGFWECAVDTAVHTYNRTPTRIIQWRTPHELWTDGHVPDVSYFRVFGSKAYVHTPEAKRKKLDPRSIEMTLVGYEPGSKGYRLWNSSTRSIVLSRDVTFDERSFPFKEIGPSPVPPPQPTVSDGPITIYYNIPSEPDGGEAPHVPIVPAPLPATPAQRPTPERAETEFHTPLSQPAAPTPPERPRPQRVRRDPGVPPRSALPGPAFGPVQPPSPRRLRPNPRPNPRYTHPDHVERVPNPRRDGRLNHFALLTAMVYAAVAEYRDPLTFKEAMRSTLAEEWRAACQYEIDALAKNCTWTLVDLPAGRKAVRSKWVFKRKIDLRYRARLVAKGFTQIFGLDYDETFSPVARFESLRLLLALAALEDWEIHQMDVKSAFLNGLLDEEIYMEQPEGFVDPDHPNKVCLLNKAIYGLKQASRAWNLQFHGVLLDLGFARTHSDAGVYHRQDDEGTIIIILYVDDITILGDSLDNIKKIKSALSSRYEMTDLGEIDSYLGVNIKRDRSTKRLEIDQSRYVLEIINRFGLSDANPARTPLPSGAEDHLKKYDGQASAADIKLYQQIIGSLLYVQIGTRPDISFAVSRLAQYASNPSAQHINLAKYVLRYLKGTSDLKLVYLGALGNGLFGYSDSSWGDDPDDRHSTAGYVYLLADAAISWTSRKQKTAAQSTTEAEYMALADAGNQAAWYRMFLEELGYDVRDPIPLHEDNKGAVDLALNPVTGRKSKHIPIKYHAIRGYVEHEQVVLIRTPTIDMLADGLTKPFAQTKLSHFVPGLGLV